MSPDIKSALKEAKVGIKEGDYEKTEKYCKIVLKHDRENYQALVLFAKACQEQNKLEDSKKALFMASKVEPETVVAWQGLAMLFDTHPDMSSPKDAITVYTKLVELVNSDDKKYLGHLKKLATAQQSSGDNLAAVDSLLLAIPFMEKDKETKKELTQNVVNLLAAVHDTLSPKKKDQLLTSLHSLLSDSVLGNNESNYKLFLSLTYKTGDMSRMHETALKMFNVFRTAFPLEWIARGYVESNLPWKKQITKISSANTEVESTNVIESKIEALETIGNNSISVITWVECVDSITRLMELHSASMWGNLAVGLHKQSSGQLSAAISRFNAACYSSGLAFANTGGQPAFWWRLLLEAYIAAQDWPSVESTVARVVRLLKDTKRVATWPGVGEGGMTKETVIDQLQITRAGALMKLGHKQHFITALELLRKLVTPSTESNVLIVKCLMLVDLPAARKELEDLFEKASDESKAEYDLMFADLMYREEDFTGAITKLELMLRQTPSSSRALVLLGKIQQQNGNSTGALSYLLRAAKLDASNGDAFLFLGHHYKKLGDKERACKCYQKSYVLNPNGEVEGAALSDIYRDLGKHAENYALLNSSTDGRGGGAAWAWLRLGLHFLSQHEPQSAISALQRCLQLQHNHRQALESLGDAYLARGSYVAAQKVHERVLLLDPTTVYPRCQIARIQLCVGEPHAAIVQFQSALQICEDDNMRSVCLIGIAQAHIIIATTNATTNHLDNTLTHCVLAIKNLNKAREFQPNSVSLWKLLGEACCLLHRLPKYLRSKGICIPSRLIKPNAEADATMLADLPTVLQIGTRCFGAALKINSSDASLWHDCGLSYYLQAKNQHQNKETVSEKKQDTASLLHRASNCIKKSLSLSPLSSESWDTLGVVSMHVAAKDLALAQHCFIRSTQLKPSSSSWSHLGALYLVCDDIKLAHQAFGQAQAVDPKSVTCWTGQALVAESVKHYDAADLFRHCCTLGVQPESCTGHAHHVVLAKQENKKVTPTEMALAADAMMFYSREFDEDPVNLNLAGLCLEEFGMKNTAADLYAMSLECLRKDNYQSNDNRNNLIDSVRSNYGRVLISLGKVQEAVTHLCAISEPDYQSVCTLALACLKGEDYEQGYAKYMAALHWMAEIHRHKSNILVALACLQYKFKKILEAKTLLFESISVGDSCLAGVLALVALGLVDGDDVLTTAALAELHKFKDSDEATHHVTFLMAAQAIANGNNAEAKNIISRALLCRPQNPELWRFLSWHLVTSSGASDKKTASKIVTTSQRGKKSVKSEEKLSQGIIASSAAASTLSQSQVTTGGGVKCHSAPTQDGCTRVLGHLKAPGQQDRALKEAQRLLLMHPGAPNSWVTLIAAARATKDSKYDVQVQMFIAVWAPKCSDKVREWLYT